MSKNVLGQMTRQYKIEHRLEKFEKGALSVADSVGQAYAWFISDHGILGHFSIGMGNSLNKMLTFYCLPNHLFSWLFHGKIGQIFWSFAKDKNRET